MATVLITGANRGIGLELARQMHQQGHEVIACCRARSQELETVTSRVFEGIDVGQDDAVEKLIWKLEETPLDVVINCAGVLENNTLENLDLDSIKYQIEVNAIGPLRVIKAVESRIVPGGKVLMITSRMGSIGDNSSGGYYGYRMSKAALNMASVSLAHDLKSRAIAVGIIHPGFVRTDMTGQQGEISPLESAIGIMARLKELNLENSGTFWHQRGEVLPW